MCHKSRAKETHAARMRCGHHVDQADQRFHASFVTFESHGMKRRDVLAAKAALGLPEGLLERRLKLCERGAAPGLAHRGGQPVGWMELQGEGEAALEERLLEAEG